VARYAGDEFLVVLPEARGHDAFDTAERIRAIISSYSPDWLGAEMEMSISGGVATFPDHGVTSDDLINSAHHALNRAKFGGKNRIFSCYELAKKAA
jgi:diguanylate cyclase (GGDEF)-like protein